MRSTTKTLAAAAVGLLLTAAQAQEARAICNPQPHELDNEATGDNWMMNAWGCNREIMSRMWKDLHADTWGDRWRDFGLNDACNNNEPMARFFNAGYLLDYMVGVARQPGCDGCQGSMLNRGYSFVRDNAKRVWPSCATDYGAVHHGPLIGRDNIELMRTFHYGSNVVWRAGTLIHESRHNTHGHDAKKNCNRKGSCDSRWEYNGANTYEIAWLWWFYEKGTPVAGPLRNYAGNHAQWVADDGFRYPPGLTIKHVDF